MLFSKFGCHPPPTASLLTELHIISSKAYTWKAQKAAHLKSLCTVHYGRYETMPQHNTVTHPHIDPLAIVAAALFKITFTLNRYI